MTSQETNRPILSRVPIVRALKFLLVGGLIWVLSRKLDLGEFAETFLGLNPAWGLAGAGLIFLSLGVRWYRWWFLLRDRAVGAGAAGRSLLVGMFASLFLPAGIGEVGRALVLPGISRTEAGGRVIVDKLCDFVWLLLLSVGGLSMATGSMPGWMGWSLVGLSWLLILGWPRVLLRLPQMALSIPGLANRSVFARIRDAVQDVKTDSLRKNILLVAATSVPHYAGIWFLFRAFSVPLEPEHLALAPLVTLSVLLPLSIGGVGIREFTAVLVFERFHISVEVILNTYLMAYASGLLLPGLLGGWIFMTSRPSGSSKHPAEDG